MFADVPFHFSPPDALELGAQWPIVCIIVIIIVILHFNSDANLHHPLHLLQVSTSQDGTRVPQVLEMGMPSFPAQYPVGSYAG